GFREACLVELVRELEVAALPGDARASALDPCDLVRLFELFGDGVSPTPVAISLRRVAENEECRHAGDLERLQLNARCDVRDSLRSRLEPSLSIVKGFCEPPREAGGAQAQAEFVFAGCPRPLKSAA